MIRASTLFLLVWKKGTTREDFVHFIDTEFDFSSFADVFLISERDVVTGLEYLHRNGIATET